MEIYSFLIGTNQMEWSQCIETFVIVARNKSFVRTAEYFSTSSSAISKRIQWLERELNSTLFRRTTRKVSLTEEGEQLFHRVSPLIDEWLDIKFNFRETKRLVGKLKLVSNPHLATIYILPHIKKFLEKYPELEISLFDNTRPIHLLEEQVDIFFGTLNFLADPATAIAKKMGALRRQCFASATYLKKFGTPNKIEDLYKHQTIVFKDMSTWNFSNHPIHVKHYLNVDTLSALVTAVREDLGIVFVPKSLIQKEIERKKLLPVLPTYQSDPVEIYLAYPKLPYMPKKTRTFLDFLLKKIKV